MKLMDSGFAIWTAVNLGSIAIARLLRLGVRSSQHRVSSHGVQGSRPTPKKAHVYCLPCCRQKTATRPAQKSFLHKVLRLLKLPRGLRCPPRETEVFYVACRVRLNLLRCHHVRLYALLRGLSREAESLLRVQSVRMAMGNSHKKSA